MAKSRYHHGNLREALVAASLDLIATHGPQGFTLSEAAKAVGVTPAAVYRHFEGREDLLAEVARQGFEIFGALMEQAWNQGRPSVLAGFEATGRAWLIFARRHPAHYMVMFESGLPHSGYPELARTARQARQCLLQAAQRLTEQLPEARRPPAAMIAAHIQALSHGIVELYARNAQSVPSPFAPEDLLETGIGIYLRGLGLIAPDQ